MLFVGVNYELNSDADLYFNVMHASLDWALRQNSEASGRADCKRLQGKARLLFGAVVRVREGS
jgi:hypothetical protein